MANVLKNNQNVNGFYLHHNQIGDFGKIVIGQVLIDRVNRIEISVESTNDDFDKIIEMTENWLSSKRDNTVK